MRQRSGSIGAKTEPPEDPARSCPADRANEDVNLALARRCSSSLAAKQCVTGLRQAVETAFQFRLMSEQPDSDHMEGLAVQPVGCEPVSEGISLLTRQNTGKIGQFW